MNGDATLSTTVPLGKYTMKVRARCILSSKSTSDIHHSLLVNGLLESERLVSEILLSLSDLLFESLSRAIGNAITSSLDWICGHVALACFVSHLGSRVGIVSSKDLVSPLGLLELLGLFISDKDRSLRFLTLSVIKLDSSFFLRVLHAHTSLLKSVLAHSTDVCELHGRVVAVLGSGVALGAEVNVRKAALMLALSSYVHL